MSFWSKLEKAEKKLEKWHNKVYKYFCIGIFILIADIIGAGIVGWSLHRQDFIQQTQEPLIALMYDFIVYLGSPAVFIFLCYTMLFTTFQFPVRFKGGGKGKSIKPISPN